VRRVGRALAAAREAGLERLDAQCVVAHVLGQSRAWVIANDDAQIDDGPWQALQVLFARRAAGEPLAYLTGEREFHGLALRVSPAVLVPRPDTEALVDWAIELLASWAHPRVIDLGTGSGAIALAVLHGRPGAEMHATDASQAALQVARGNGAALGLNVQWHLGSWWEAAPAGTFHLALSNPPYVAAGDPHLAGLRHEPASALVPAGDRGDGMADIERIVDGAAARLAPGGWLLLEHGVDQAQRVRDRLAAVAFDAVLTRTDLAGRPRVTGGRRAR
jgi:release factor glutamine methyltransferase